MPCGYCALRGLNDQASKIKWSDNAVPDTQESEFKKISAGVGAADPEGRWDFYKNNVSELLKGGNPYESMRAVLARVGVTTVTGQNYNQQFGITLATHKPVEIVGSKSTNLMAATGEALSETPDGPDLTAEQEAQLWAQAEPLFEQLKQTSEETSAMWIPDIRPDAGFLVGAAVAVAATSPVQAADNYVYGVCRVARPGYDTMIRPTYAGGSYLFNYHGNDPRYKEKLSSGEFFAGAKVTLIKAPAHGKVIREEGPWSSETDYQYRPDEDYAGKDRFVMQVEKHGVKVRIHYLMVVPQEGESLKGHCNPESWKISPSFTTPTLDKAALQSLLDATGINNAVTVTTAELSGGAVGQTTGSTITLDIDAAGYSWYIDYTPYLNDEYLPTSNPNEWVAKAGTEAANKIDLLSVLRHEYGHAVGLDHTADGHNYMAATLQPSVRRLPSSEELSLMAQLAGQAKLALEGNGTPDTPQSPGLPIGAGLSALLVGRLRSTRYGSWSPAFESLQIPAPVPQFEVAANPTLANGKLESGEGWATQGNVAIGNGTATLSEVSASQTRLNQVFVVSPHDRYLTFTVANIALDDQANNGASLADSIGLSRTYRLVRCAGRFLRSARP
jgi:hypothetical protein